MTRVATLSIYSLLCAILILSGFSISLSAQSGSIRLEGIVWDPSGNSLSGAVLTATEDSTKRQADTVSDSNGEYVFLALQPGVYTVTVKAKGFKDVIHRSISIFNPGTAYEDFSFEVSAIDKESAAGETARLKESANSGSLSREEIEALPFQDRNPLSLIVYQPGVQIAADPGSSTINGTRPAMNGIGMDGISVTDPVQPRFTSPIVAINPDTISDIQIVTTGAKAEYGRSGGAQFVLTSRPGTKTWSGDVYDYFRNKHLDANEFFNNSHGVARPSFTRDIFGGTLSGPAFGKSNLLFLNFEGNRTDQQLTRNRLVLTEEAKAGLFRWYTPGTTASTADPKSFDIVANDPRHLGIDPQIAQILAKLPAVNNTSIGDGLNTGGFSFNSPAYLNRQSVNLRLDHRLTSNHQLFFRFNWDRIDSTDILNSADETFPGEQSGKYMTKNWGLTAGSDWVLSPNMINELRVGYMRPATDLERPARLSGPMFLANTWTNPLDPSFPRSYKTPVFEISDYLSHSRTLHTFKYGVNFRRTVQSISDITGVYPNVTFGLNNGNAPSVSIGPSGVSNISNANRQTFENLYNDLLGRIESVDKTFGGGSRDFSSLEYSGFIQDDWRVRPNFTLNLGLRYELYTAPKKQNGSWGVLDRVPDVSPSAQISDFKLTSGQSWYSRDWKNFAPRAGFAWDPFKSGTMVIRGGYGIYYDRLIGAVTNFVDQNSYLASQTEFVYPNATGGDVRLSDGIPVPPSPILYSQPPLTRATSVAVLNPNLRTPRVDQFNLTLEKRMFGAMVEAGYVGTRGTRLFQFVNLNQTKTSGDFLQAFKELQAYRSNGTPLPASNTLLRIFGSPIAALDALGGTVLDTGQAGLAADILDRNYFSNYAAAGVSDFYIRNFPQFDNFLYGSSSSKSWYNALQLGIRKSSRSYNFRAYYTWSKSLDTISADGSSFVSPADSLNPEQNKAPSDFDRTHVFNLAFSYALPFGRTRSADSDTPKWIGAAFGGWNVGLLWIRESGQRFSVNSGLQNQYAGVTGLADFSGDRSMGQIYHNNGIVYWFDTAQARLFTYPGPGEASNSGRNSFTGPGFENLDLLLYKRFFIRESKSLQFRIEAFNVLNSTNFSVPDTNLYSPTFGTVVSTQGNPRRLQVALRFQF